MRIRRIKETNGEVYKMVKFTEEELQGDFVTFIDELLKGCGNTEKQTIFYTNISKGGTELKNKVVKKVERVIEAGFVARNNDKCYFKIITSV